MRSTRSLVLAIVCFVSVAPCARPAYAGQEQAPISEGKRQLILELIDLINQRTSIDQVADAMLREMGKVFAQSYEQEIQASSEFTTQEKERLIKDQQVMSEKMMTRFRERFANEVDFQKFQEDMMLSLYDKYFTEQELGDIVAFYKTPTGQKTLVVMPELAGESIRRSNELIGAQVMQIAREVVQQTLDEVRAQHKRTKRRVQHN